MSVDGSVFALELDGLLGAGNGIQRSTQNTTLGVAIDLALVLLHLDELRLAFEIVKQIHAGKFRQVQAGRDLRKAELCGFAVGVGFLVDEGGFGDGGRSGALFLVLFRSWPIDERRREFLPFLALGAVVANTVSFDFILCDGLIGAVFEDEAAGELLGGGLHRQSQDEGGERKCGNYDAM